MKDVAKSNVPMLLITGGLVVNDDSIYQADVLIEGDIIKQVGNGLEAHPGCRVIDASGKYIMPGGVDPHVHFNFPTVDINSIDDFYTGTKAAVSGGTTMIIDFVMPNKNESLNSAYDKYRSWADPNVCCDYGLSVIIRQMSDKVKTDMQELVTNKGVNSFKFFMAYHGVLQVTDRDFYQGLVHCKNIGALARVHAENGDLISMKEKELIAKGITGPEGHLQARPEECQAEATQRACLLAKEANCPLYVVHVMSSGAADAIGNARKKGGVVFGEAIAAGLAGVDGEAIFDSCWNHAAAHVMSPPISVDRSTADQLMDSLAAGQLQMTGSDHAVFNSSQKALGKNDFTKIPNGVNGVEERMMIVWHKGVNTGKIDPMRFVAVTSSTAAKLFNIYPMKGRISPGSDADIVVWDPQLKRTISAQHHISNCDFNIFEGMTCIGSPFVTISRGQVVYENGQVKTEKGSGKFISMSPFAPHVYTTINQREKTTQPIKVDRQSNGGSSTKSRRSFHQEINKHYQSLARPPPVASSPAVALASVTPMNPVTCTPTSSTPSATSPSSTVNSFDDVPVGGKMAAMYISATQLQQQQQQQDFHARPATRAGGRNLQDSSFSLSGAQIDDDQGSRRSTKISKPPGGESSGLW